MLGSANVRPPQMHISPRPQHYVRPTGSRPIGLGPASLAHRDRAVRPSPCLLVVGLQIIWHLRVARFSVKQAGQSSRDTFRQHVVVVPVRRSTTGFRQRYPRQVVARDNGPVEDRAEAMIVAVPFDAVRELEQKRLALPRTVFRGAALDAVVAVGMDAAALVTLLQAPDSVRAFATWVRDRCTQSRDSIELSARRGGRQVRLTVDGDIDVGVVADFLAAAFADRDTEP